jgi:acid phosphatase
MNKKRSLFLTTLILVFVLYSCRPENNLDQFQRRIPVFNKIVVVIGENERASTVFDSLLNAPFINSLAHSGAEFTASFGIQHPSQPNYLCLFSGSNQGVSDNDKPAAHFTSVNLARELLNAGKTFCCFSEDLPYTGFDDQFSGLYARKHNPVSNWTGSGPNQVPESYNRPFSEMPSDFSHLPSVSFVIPNLCNDGHDLCAPDSNRTKQFDRWLENNFSVYANWCIHNNSLLIVTYDEDDWTSDNRIATVFYGAHVKQGVYADTMNHFTLLRTIEDAMNLSKHCGAASAEKPIDFCWTY